MLEQSHDGKAIEFFSQLRIRNKRIVVKDSDPPFFNRGEQRFEAFTVILQRLGHGHVKAKLFQSYREDSPESADVTKLMRRRVCCQRRISTKETHGRQLEIVAEIEGLGAPGVAMQSEAGLHLAVPVPEHGTHTLLIDLIKVAVRNDLSHASGSQFARSDKRRARAVHYVSR